MVQEEFPIALRDFPCVYRCDTHRFPCSSSHNHVFSVVLCKIDKQVLYQRKLSKQSFMQLCGSSATHSNIVVPGSTKIEEVGIIVTAGNLF